jgi:hypothetical protein
MRFTKFWMAATAVILAACGAARANDLLIDMTPDRPTVGVGIMCNTSEQAVHYVGLLAGGQGSVAAMAVVNAEARNPRACGVATVAFLRDATLETKKLHGKLVQIVRINVVAGYSGGAWQNTSGMVQYAVMEPAGESI